ncbi:hypothetical protein tinsulaeT_19090 [Thalassotalea insulae]|uniref:Solute-binding protein family 3/N-terminal domain-containing protein n=1 Tax=Thalassotalea insulae TaxID=2056778 RepID=A0ABQ6GSH5_9GAMM|nr:transporter substrate-binding domain-containing protein [Thalassotalea insulae]GLX78569.1 hypothetical protein tinsulaeT_19090 [Thalassotalea insulae]
MLLRFLIHKVWHIHSLTVCHPIRYLLFSTLICFQCTGHSQTIKIAAIDWCPQICLDKQRPGYVIEIVNQVFKNSPYQITIDYYPWSRAIKYVTEGSYDALLSPAKKEAPDLTYPEQAVGHQKMCFFTKAQSSWHYRGPNSLDDQYVGVAADTSIEELNQYIKEHPQHFQFQPYHERYVKQNAGKVLKNRIDSFIFTLNTTNYTLAQLNLTAKFKNAGCVSVAPIYIALTPIAEKQDAMQAIASFWDKRYAELQSQGVINKVITKYRIE